MTGGTGRRYSPIMSGLKQPTSTGRHEDNVHETNSANVEPRVTIRKKKFSPCNGKFT